MFRLAIFLLTNFAAVFLLSVAVSLLMPFLPETWQQSNLTGIGLYALALGMGGSMLSLFMSKTLALRSVGAKIIKSPSNEYEAFLMQALEELSRQAKIKTSQLAIYGGADVNAFATGWAKNHSVVAVSVGLLRGLEPNQVRGVLAHEVAHIANGDMVTMALLQGVMNTFVILFARLLADFVARIVSLNSYQWIYTLVYWLFNFLFGGIALIIVMWFSRRREFRADLGAASIDGPKNLYEALYRLSNTGSALPKNLSAMGIIGNKGWFSSHPPMEERLKKLENFARREGYLA